MSVNGVWAYAVIGGDATEDRIAGLRGVAGESVRAVAAGGVAAAVGTVELGEFGENALRRNLEDLDWVAAKARAHDAVITAISKSGPVIPVRMATVYLDDTHVARLLEDRRDDFMAALHRVAGREELGVKAYADLKSLMEQADSATQEGENGSGTAYLLRRRRQLTSQQEAYRVAAEEAEHIHAALLKHAVDGKRKPATDRSLSGRDGWMVLNGTYLVEQGVVGLFRETVAVLDLSTARINLELTGPWPPYSFAGDMS
jgi:hypothetical protein